MTDEPQHDAPAPTAGEPGPEAAAADGAFRLGYVPGATPAKWVRTWRARLTVPLELVPLETVDAGASVRSGAVHAALVRRPVETHDGHERVLHAIPLYDEVPVVVAAKEHLFALADEVTLDELAEEIVWHPLDDRYGWAGLAEEMAAGRTTARDTDDSTARDTDDSSTRDTDDSTARDTEGTPTGAEDAPGTSAADSTGALADAVTGAPPGTPGSMRPAHAKEAVEIVASGVGVVVLPMSVARLHHRRDVVAVPLVDGPTSGVSLVWPAHDADPLCEELVGIVRGRSVNSSRGAAAQDAHDGASEDGAAGGGAGGRGARALTRAEEARRARAALEKREADRRAASARKRGASVRGKGRGSQGRGRRG